MNGSEISSKRHLSNTAEDGCEDEKEFAEGSAGAELSRAIRLLKFVSRVDSIIYGSSKQMLSS